jgi:hypothetical protein
MGFNLNFGPLFFFFSLPSGRPNTYEYRDRSIHPIIQSWFPIREVSRGNRTTEHRTSPRSVRRCPRGSTFAQAQAIGRSLFRLPAFLPPPPWIDAATIWCPAWSAGRWPPQSQSPAVHRICIEGKKRAPAGCHRSLEIQLSALIRVLNFY